MQKYSRRLHVRLIQNGFPLFFFPTAVFLRLPHSERPSFSVFFRLRPKHFPHYLDLSNGSQRVEIILILFGFFFLSPLPRPRSVYLSLSLFLSLSLSVRPSLYLSPPLYSVHYNTTALSLRREYTLFNHVVISLNAYPQRDRINQNV